MPAAPPTIFTPPSAGSTPAAVGAIFTPPSAGSTPAAVGAIFTPPSAGSTPAAAGAIFTPPSAGSSPAAVGAIYEQAPAGKQVLAISGVSTSGVNGNLIYAGLNDSKAAWSTDGTLTPGASNTIAKSTSGVWSLARGSAYSATKTSAANSPDGLTGWTVGTGTGSPVIAAASVAAPGAVFIPAAASLVAATLTTTYSGANKNLLLTARNPGVSGNDITFDGTLGGPNLPILVTVVGSAISVRNGTGAGASPNSPASAVKAAIQANSLANSLVVVAFAPGNDGTGLGDIMTTTNLSGGSGGVTAPPAIFTP